MKKTILLLVSAVLLFTFCEQGTKNPFFTEFNTPFHVPPFDKIKLKHYLPAFKEGVKQQKQAIDAIVDTTASPTFQNTIVAMENSDTLLRKVSGVFDVLRSSMTNDKMQEIAKEVDSIRTANRDDILLNKKLFQKVKSVYDKKNDLNLTTEQNTLLEEYYKNFVRGGANLNEEEKTKLRKINQDLSRLSLEFGDHILAENNRYELVIEKEENLAGLPQSVRDAAAKAAEERGHKGKWVFTLHRSSITPFLKYSQKRDLREKIFKAYIHRGDNDDKLDNKEIVSKMASLRVKKADLLGYKTHAHFVLEENMAKNPDNVDDLLYQIWWPALGKAKEEAKALQELINQEGKDFQLQPWDWWYYAEKLKKEKYNLDDEMLKPYFELENVRNGAFSVANKLYGLQFVERKDIPKYHEDVKIFEVKEEDGSLVGIFYADYFSRGSKRGGAWMNHFRKQYRINGKEIHPVVTNNLNLSEPSGDNPVLLTFDEVTTLFHEFGHALHGLLSDCAYHSLSGTSVPRDFVELPSQIMENWASEPKVLKSYATHYETGEPIPQTLIDKIEKARHFNQGFATVEYLAASFLDMAWHTITEPKERDVEKFENQAMNEIGLIPEIVVRYRSTYFQHIFSGGYSAGYYSYIWSEVLDSDAFQAFKETSLFDDQTARSFRENILEKGGTEDPMILYKRFRGAEPKVKYLLEKRGLI